MLFEVRKHISPRTLARARPQRAVLNSNKPPQRIIRAGAEARLQRLFGRPVERRIALEIFREVRREPVFLEDLSTRIAGRHRNDRVTLSPMGTTANGIRSLYWKLVEKKLIIEKK
jgi:hypothetical protein